MGLKRLFAVLTAALTALALFGFSSPAGADGNNESRSFVGTDPSSDAEFSSLCVIEDKEPDPYLGTPPTGLEAGNCDNNVPAMDFTAYGLEYLPAGDAGALLDPAGNDGIWGTNDDGQGPDGKPGTGDEPTITRTVGTLKATWNFASAWPAANHVGAFAAPGSQNSEVMSGLSAFMAYRNPDIQNNKLQAACDRNANSFVKWNGLSPTPTINTTTTPPSGGNPAYIFDPRGGMHWEDGTYFHIWVSWELKGGTGTQVYNSQWQPKINFGYYDPSIDNDIHYSETPALNPLYNPKNTGVAGSNPWTGLGSFYDFQFNSTRTQLTVRIPAVYVDVDTGCLDQGTGPNQEPYAYWPYARSADVKTGPLAPRSIRTGQILNPGNGQNDKLMHIFARTMVSVRPTLPVPIPTGSLIGAAICPTLDNQPSTPLPIVGVNVPPKCPNALRSDIDWVIGLGFTADDLQLPDGSDAFRGSLDPLGLPPTLGPGAFAGPTCAGATFGGNLPTNPLYNPGNKCALRHPYNDGLRPNNNHIHIF